MPVELGWGEVALRLGLAMAASFVIGLNRDERGRAVGLRTTMLVCLAATISMIQANLLINTIGKKPDSFVVLDLMRLPLGIFSGMGFIGAGAIVRRGDMAHGVTTAATLWFVTAMGICFGGGQIWLGLASLVIAFLALWLLRYFEKLLVQRRRAFLTLVADAEGPSVEEIRGDLGSAGYRIASLSVAYADRAKKRLVKCEVHWRGREGSIRPPDFIERLANAPGVERVQWKPESPH
jgi:putative Mg2+ transporter-C (MgtC) family protein